MLAAKKFQTKHTCIGPVVRDAIEISKAVLSALGWIFHLAFIHLPYTLYIGISIAKLIVLQRYIAGFLIIQAAATCTREVNRRTSTLICQGNPQLHGRPRSYKSRQAVELCSTRAYWTRKTSFRHFFWPIGRVSEVKASKNFYSCLHQWPQLTRLSYKWFRCSSLCIGSYHRHATLILVFRRQPMDNTTACGQS
jgi:hypothetical protein